MLSQYGLSPAEWQVLQDLEVILEVGTNIFGSHDMFSLFYIRRHMLCSNLCPAKPLLH